MRETTPCEVFVSGANEGSSELALTVDEHRAGGAESEMRKRLGRCEAVAVRFGSVRFGAVESGCGPWWTERARHARGDHRERSRLCGPLSARVRCGVTVRARISRTAPASGPRAFSHQREWRSIRQLASVPRAFNARRRVRSRPLNRLRRRSAARHV